MTDEEMLAEIRARLDWNDGHNHRPGTCGACLSFNSKQGGYDTLERGRCSGWRDVDGDHRNVGYVDASSTCERYKEDTSYLEEIRRSRPQSEKAHLAIKKRYRDRLDRTAAGPPMSEEESNEKLSIYLKWLEGR